MGRAGNGDRVEGMNVKVIIEKRTNPDDNIPPFQKLKPSLKKKKKASTAAGVQLLHLCKNNPRCRRCRKCSTECSTRPQENAY